MPINELHDQKAWNELLLSQSTQSGIFLQSWEWGEFQKAAGRQVYRYHAHDGFAQVIELPLPMGKKYWFIPRGTVIEELIEEARKHKVLFVRFEPLSGTAPHGAVKTKPVSPTQTLLIDLTKSEDELLAGMHEKTRYNVRLALRKSVRVDSSQSTTAMAGQAVHSFEQFWKLLQETAKRDKFHTHPREYYEKMLTIFESGGSDQATFRRGLVTRSRDKFFVQLHLAYSGTTPLAAAIVGYFGDTATYLHGASSYEHRALMGPYALHWEIMKDAKTRGYKFYDFWGVNLRPTSYVLRPQKWEGMTRFKMGFGGQVVDYPGTFDLPLSKYWYTLYRFGRRLVVG